MKRKPPRPAVSPPKKPQPEARGPNRAWSGAWSAAGNGEPRVRSARTERPRTASKRNGAKAANGVSEGVALGYRVIQEYLRQGERVARSFWSFGEDDADRYDPARLVDRALRSAQDLAGAFSEIVRVLAKNAPPASDGRSAAGFDFDPPRRAARHQNGEADRPSPIVALSVRSRWPVKVALQLAEGSAGRVFRVPPLVRAGKGAARLAGVALATGPGGQGVAITLAVPPSLAKGRYQGPVLDGRTRRPIGFLSIDVGAA